MAKSKKVTTESSVTANSTFMFGKQNYMLMIVGLVVIILGFILMYGKEDIYDFRKTTLAPIVVIAGFLIQIVAIMKKSKSA
ncbi:MAG: hypothetical protein ACJA19_001079 [Bacteroidia bacterium]|jgi:hypothetical protein|tara:strand:- start:16751 stop:16993 length:243 start_codon:yes stop_codon:yes gene_type:complete